MKIDFLAKDVRGLLGRVIQILTILFGAFNKFLPSAAPKAIDAYQPDYPVGLVSFLGLGLLLLISAHSLGLKRHNRRSWLKAATAFLVLSAVIGVTYPITLSLLQYTVNDTTVVAGLWLSDHAKERKDRGESLQKIVIDTGPDFYRGEEIWPTPSTSLSKALLLLNYVALVFCLLAFVFISVEVVFLTDPPAEDHPSNPKG